MLAALVFALRLYLRIPMHIPGKSGIFWVVPIIVGVGIVGKFGSGVYIGLLSGVLAALFGMGDNGVLRGHQLPGHGHGHRRRRTPVPEPPR